MPAFGQIVEGAHEASRPKILNYGRQDKAGGPAAVAALLRDCLHVVFRGPGAGSLRRAFGS